MGLETSYLESLAGTEMQKLVTDELVGIEEYILVPSPQTILPIKSFIVDGPEPFVQYDLQAVYGSIFPLFEHKMTLYVSEEFLFFCHGKNIQLATYVPQKKEFDFLTKFTHTLFSPEDLVVQALMHKETILHIGEYLTYPGFHVNKT